jgi:hypothetical protein
MQESMDELIPKRACRGHPAVQTVEAVPQPADCRSLNPSGPYPAFTIGIRCATGGRAGKSVYGVL